MDAKGYTLSPGTQVREEDFGLLFYTMQGPRLFFLNSGKLIGSDFFNGQQTLEQLTPSDAHGLTGKQRFDHLKAALRKLAQKGVINEH